MDNVGTVFVDIQTDGTFVTRQEHVSTKLYLHNQIRAKPGYKGIVIPMNFRFFSATLAQR